MRMAARLYSIGFLGSGKMATAMARGLISAGDRAYNSVCCYLDARV